MDKVFVEGGRGDEFWSLGWMLIGRGWRDGVGFNSLGSLKLS